MRMTMKLNGESVTIEQADAGQSLLRLLRDGVGARGTKGACEQGECGSCTVLLDGRAVNSCLVAAGQADGCSVDTVEGISPCGGTLSALQAAFTRFGAVQCGFCTPGLLLAAQELLDAPGPLSEADIREALAGNLCRCTGYEKVIAAVWSAAAIHKGMGQR